ncbi:MAG: hypothetical protein A2648_02825 [Candidatus Lloydbacteria bacterium RIFCSPHIGHO2_01_FULL_41_20]|uniref:DUF5666 domain-containing protein n=1 Tax=Candidatus Lloydbacteria bacterium RIFCSPHIGHO2_01_FULL_41_20 TaxID=1798657 RepID=A0A1G2CVJ6_9BACT|nr:MAG: hypothetical protein A2648_02825 [Candidatus Lloydbacteria bacterium RIFCSPHIGHO2_01_FULL_41_20]
MERIFFVTILLFLLSPVITHGAVTNGGDIRITSEGEVSIKKAKVFQVAGGNFYTRIYWDDVFLRVTVITNKNTKIKKNYGEPATVGEIKEGDILDIEGAFPGSSDSFIITATSIRNISLTKEKLTTSGTVLSVKEESDEFIMKTKKGNTITVTTSGTKILRGIIPISIGEIKAWERVISAEGVYDYANDVLNAEDIQIYQDQSVFLPHNFKGKIKSISGTSLPAQIVVGLTKKDYTVNITNGTKLINKTGSDVSFARILVGDIVRFYGAVRKTDLNQVDDVEIFRDLDL